MEEQRRLTDEEKVILIRLAQKEHARKVKAENKRAKDKGLEATLTASQWMQTVQDFIIAFENPPAFRPACIYCGRLLDIFQISIDHWIPIASGGGTTVDNCVPSCYDCNMMKSSLTGDDYFDLLINRFKSEGAAERYARAKGYLEAVRAGNQVEYGRQEFYRQIERMGKFERAYYNLS